MNLKKAKLLRRAARETLPEGTPLSEYELVNTAKNVLHPGTMRVSRKTIRGRYRALKNYYSNQ